MSSTDLAYGASCLRACYAVSGTDLAYGTTSGFALAMRCPRMVLPGADIPRRHGPRLSGGSIPLSSYAPATRCPALATRCPVLTARMMLPGQRSELEEGVREDHCSDQVRAAEIKD
eukprot:1252478-Rhodomonas_salina.5